MIDPTQIKDTWGWESLMDSQAEKVNRPTSSTKTTRTAGEETMPETSTSTFNYPDEWNQAGDFWSNMMSGDYTNPAMSWMSNMMQSGGDPVDVTGWGEAQQPAMMDQYSNMVKQMAEQSGMGGTRYSSGLLNQISNYGGQLQNQFQANLMDRWLQAQEAGKGRAFGAGNLLSQMGAGAGENMMSLGNLKSQLPLQVAQTMGGLGQSLTNQQVDPWTQMMMQLIGPTGQAYPQTYQPTGWQDILSGLGGTLPAGLDEWDQEGWWG